MSNNPVNPKTASDAEAPSLEIWGSMEYSFFAGFPLLTLTWSGSTS